MTEDRRQPLALDIVLVAGDDYSRSWIVTETAVAYVHTGATIVTTIENDAGTAQATNFTASFATVGSATHLTYSLTDTETTTLGVGTYRWSLKVTKSGVTQSWFSGRLQVKDREYAGAAESSTATTLSLTTSTGTALGLTVTAAGTMTAAEILTAIKTVDGAGSGLDADLLDGISSAGFDTAGSAAAAQAAAIAASQPLDSDLTAIAALTTTAYGRAFLELANQAALVALLPSYQPLDSDLTSIAALSTTAYGRAFLALADQAALVALLPSYQPLDSDLTTIAAGNNGSVLAATTASFLTADESKLDGIEAGADVTDAANVAAAGAVMLAQTINAQTGTTYTLDSTDAGKLVTLSNAAAITLTVPQDSDETIAVGTYIDLYQLGAGQVTVVAGTGATLRVGGLTAKARAQYSSLGVQKVSANTWRLYGDLASS